MAIAEWVAWLLAAGVVLWLVDRLLLWMESREYF